MFPRLIERVRSDQVDICEVEERVSGLVRSVIPIPQRYCGKRCEFDIGIVELELLFDDKRSFAGVDLHNLHNCLIGMGVRI